MLTTIMILTFATVALVCECFGKSMMGCPMASILGRTLTAVRTTLARREKAAMLRRMAKAAARKAADDAEYAAAMKLARGF